MRVLMLASYFPRPTNPIMGTWALSQAHALQRQGVDVVVVSFNSWVPRALAVTKGAARYALCPLSYQWDHLPVFYPRWLSYSAGPLRAVQLRYPEIPARIAWVSAKGFLHETIQRFQPDLVYAHHSATNGYLAWRLKQSRGLPYVVTDHDFWEISSCAAFPSRRRYYSRIVREAATVVAVAARMERELLSLFPGIVTQTVHNGADRIPASIEATPRPAALAGRLVLFSCAAFYERKGLPVLVEAFARIAGRFPDSLLRIAGDGPERPRIEACIDRYRLNDRIQLLGAVPHETVLQEMCWSDAFVLLGWDEPFGVVFAEALAAAKPILCCNDGGINDVLQNGKTALTVPPKNPDAAAQAMAALLQDSNLRREIGMAGHRLFEASLTWDRNAEQMQRIFAEALKTTHARVRGRSKPHELS